MADPKYGPNELDHLIMCPRCSEAVPVYLRRSLTGLKRGPRSTV
jgi:hypothetical protein